MTLADAIIDAQLTERSVDHKLMTVQDVADFCQVEHRAVTEWIAAGQLSHIRLGADGLVRVTREDLTDFLELQRLRAVLHR